MFNPLPSTSGAAVCMPTTLAPAQYTGTGTPDFDTPLGDTLPASIDPETAAGLASNLRAALPRIRELLGLLTRRGKEDG